MAIDDGGERRGQIRKRVDGVELAVSISEAMLAQFTFTIFAALMGTVTVAVCRLRDLIVSTTSRRWVG